jgi:hypothetical protein
MAWSVSTMASLVNNAASTAIPTTAPASSPVNTRFTPNAATNEPQIVTVARMPNTL